MWKNKKMFTNVIKTFILPALNTVMFSIMYYCLHFLYYNVTIPRCSSYLF